MFENFDIRIYKYIKAFHSKVKINQLRKKYIKTDWVKNWKSKKLNFSEKKNETRS